MHYFFEAIFVAFYITVLYLLLLPLKIKNILIFFFLLGFLKHFLAYFLQIHSYYCNYGFQCNRDNITGLSRMAVFDNVVSQSILEGLSFLLIGPFVFFFLQSQKMKILFVFVLGFLTHIFSEWIGLHSYFCHTNCIDVPLKRVDVSL